MANYRVDDIRTVALVGHEQAGKTSLADALLFKAKASDRRGSVDDGTSVSDFDEEEKKHKYSIDSSLLHMDFQGKRIYLLDSPGKPDFLGQAIGTLGGDNIQFDKLLGVIRDSLGKNCVLFNVPDKVGAAFSAVVSVLTPPASPPAGLPVDIAAERSWLIDAIVESDEALMEKYLGEGDVSADELANALPTALAAGTIVPIFCTSTKAGKDIGVAEFLDAIAKFAPSPKQGPKRKGTKGSGDKAAEVAI